MNNLSLSYAPLLWRQSKNITVLSWNIPSVTLKYSEFEAYIHNVVKYSIVCITIKHKRKQNTIHCVLLNLMVLLVSNIQGVKRCHPNMLLIKRRKSSPLLLNWLCRILMVSVWSVSTTENMRWDIRICGKVNTVRSCKGRKEGIDRNQYKHQLIKQSQLIIIHSFLQAERQEFLFLSKQFLFIFQIGT